MQRTAVYLRFLRFSPGCDLTETEVSRTILKNRTNEVTALTERKKRDVKAEQDPAVQNDTARKSIKKNKKWYPAVIALGLLVVLLVVISPFGGKKTAEQDEAGVSVFMSGQPEFFSTIKPEKLQDAEADVADDAAKAATYFEKSLFVGDSQMVRIQNAKLQHGKISEILQYALFMTVDTCTWQAMSEEFTGGPLTFNLYGDFVTLVEAIEKSGSEKVFIQIGREDLALGEAETAVDHARSALRSLKQASPETEIIVLALTPNTASSEVFPNNEKIHLFNTGLETVCLEYGFRFVKSETAFPQGVLPDEYCLNPEGSGEDLNTDGVLIWVTELAEAISNPIISAQPTAAPVPDGASGEGAAAESGVINVAGRKAAAIQ